jgi:RNA polymerase sigma-70 factor (ECF subfamily)
VVPPTKDCPAGEHDASYADLKLRLERAAQRVAPSWLRDQIDDLVQMALVKIMRSNKVEDDEVMNESFLYRVMHSVIVDEIRRQKRRKETGMDPELPEPVEPNVHCDPEAMAGGQEIGTVIVECLALLSIDRRRAVTLYLQGHTVPETGRRLGFTPKKSENLVYRGLAELRAHLKARGVEP